ncbi:hypothetical protein Cgig2_000953 [Carnegiea gigantea]|uniref:Endonuclease/exonuclease/phosphatase domain-containing protein n=1 Tax=Carnegiea gigantea TaxID=171969 RepID=A0A9Q1GVC4_9CARY|nr:hypothetical protein Cgig2_000953 [Carnegiea gigantea]
MRKKPWMKEECKLCTTPHWKALMLEDLMKVQGPRKRNFLVTLKELIRRYTPKILILVETKISGDIAYRVRKKIGFNGISHVEANGFRGDLGEFARHNSRPWLLVGDFNDTSSMEERRNCSDNLAHSKKRGFDISYKIDQTTIHSWYLLMVLFPLTRPKGHFGFRLPGSHTRTFRHFSPTIGTIYWPKLNCCGSKNLKKRSLGVKIKLDGIITLALSPGDGSIELNPFKMPMGIGYERTIAYRT